MTVQVPALTKVKVVPLTVQTPGVVEDKVTARPELAVATKAPGVVPRFWLPGETKLMVCAAGATMKVCATMVAAAKLVLPPWLAVTEQLPAVTRASEVPLTVQTAGVVEANETARPEDEVADRAAGVVPQV